MMVKYMIMTALACLLNGCSTRIGVVNNSDKDYYDFMVIVGEQRLKRVHLFAGKASVMEKVSYRMPDAIKIEWADELGTMATRELSLPLPRWARGQPEGILLDIQPNEVFIFHKCDWRGRKEDKSSVYTRSEPGR